MMSSDLFVNLKHNDTSPMSGILYPVSTNGTVSHEVPEPDSIISSLLYLSVSIASMIGNLTMVGVILCKQRFRK